MSVSVRINQFGRLFISRSQYSLNRNFNDMSQHDIIRLCGNELGSEGKMYARDNSKHPYLIEELNRRVLTEDGRQRWMTLTGLRPFLDWFDKTVFPTVSPKFLSTFHGF